MSKIIDISNKELLIPYLTVAKMWDVKKYIVDLKKDTLIKLGKESGEGIQYYVLKDMVVRIKKYDNEHGKKPENVWIVKPKTTATDIKPTEDWQKNKYILAIQKLIGKFNNFTEFVERLRAYAKTKKGLYKYYLNSRFIGTQKEINALTNGLMGNCVDWSQLGRAVAVIMGYKCDYIQWQCQSVTHLTIRISGKEFNKPTVVDLAAIVDWNSRRYELGEHWCSNNIVSVNPGWMNE